MKIGIFWELATHIPELPENSIVEVYGFESTGKTSLGLYIIKKAKEQKLNTLFLDTERALHKNYLELYNLKDLEIQEPSNLKEVFEIISKLKNTVVVWDTLASTPATEEEKNLGLALQAREISQLLRVYNRNIRTNGVILVVINQARLPLLPYQEAIAPGGLSLDFYSDFKILLKRKKLEEQRLEAEMVVKKNKFASPQGSAYIVFTEGVLDEDETIIKNALEIGIVSKKPRGYIYKKEEVTPKDLKSRVKEIKKDLEDYIRKSNS